ncbi:GDP-Man:Man(3)GlcNAc(2)-PP-Dol alpha-1:2-mannosyltransferase-like isoform X2 [Dinothrombium tinctorium]|uniref:GDP-Man:Man(3)GlcNAc(2)-PP-Dol alpha-1,2-mannosyltransferase n=1 Tax=Dinothrombium tinctorium TaxID=1965070 RepID=A0A443RND6_9ACAR|nr:GDP-Man:Man(3)GlcNAc(2)-PP-Dol alpha-1:2-mannosyltransferase-like isoform X2 [Dinothrombium tinctorium]RWS12785.1 GDP-Man:Man(3)GlcNAc(2)-PP-Dol alpha-1:2-mannosyltransferase-like isoform X2 [Dinothrombium tinctorium]RWS16783.1 GDP-Man:Man(3)GlcNAc(2)-PP-Dol alpha-1:2-mannosyltransferase-like isoform X2 [Dinothrombium tinctorium]
MAAIIAAVSISLFMAIATIVCMLRIRKALRTARDSRPSIAFFHPYCNAGGGGERVLWLALIALQHSFPDFNYIVYSGDRDVNGEQIISRVNSVFDIKIERPVQFVFLKRRHLLEASNYPFFTLLFQSLASIIVAIEALFKHTPDIFFDTMGYSFSFPVFKFLGGCKVLCYVHYPTISSDMLSAVSSATVSFNNRSFISNSVVLTNLKLLYYRLFALTYGFVGRMADIIFVNSSWTKNHILSIWKVPSKTFLLYPPCNVSLFESLNAGENDSKTIVSISQFRPEKNHALQLSAFKLLLQRVDSEIKSLCKLVIVGSCRNSEDEKRVQELKEQCNRLAISNQVEFKINVNFHELLEIVKKGKIGIHTMRDEHFGISNVELMAAGLVVVAHNSGGPKLDVIKHSLTGFLATEAEEYAEILHRILCMSNDQLNYIRKAAKADSQRFSDDKFKECLLIVLKPILSKY